MRRLIINADDLGLTAGVNHAIERCHAEGVVTSCTLMANSTAFDDAVAMTRKHASLGVGCHVVLVDGRPLGSHANLRSLVTATGEFPGGFAQIARRALRGKLKADEIRSEVTAQISKLQSAGIAVSHVDSHKHVHMFTAVLRPTLEAAHDCGVRAVRNPFPAARPLAYAHLIRQPKLWTRYTEVKLLASLRTSFETEAKRCGMLTTDGTFGVVSTGALDLDLFRAIVGCIPEGTWEFVCHPGYHDQELDRFRTRLRESRVKEMEVLTSPEARASIEQRGIELISYRDLPS